MYVHQIKVIQLELLVTYIDMIKMHDTRQWTAEIEQANWLESWVSTLVSYCMRRMGI